MIKYLRNLCLLTGVDNGEVDGVHGEDKQHIANALDESSGNGVRNNGEEDGQIITSGKGRWMKYVWSGPESIL